MKLASTIKKCLGLLYVSALGFSVVGINKTIQTKAVDEYDAGMPFSGTWSLKSNSGTGLTELCLTRDSDSEEFFFEPQSATYYSLCETADIVCSAYYYDENNQNTIETLSDTTVTIHLDSVSTPTINATNGTYTISGDFPNDSVSGVSYTVSRSIYTEDSSNLDPHLSSTPDGGWVDESGSLVYRIDEQTTADYYANYIEYHTETIGQQQTRDEAIFFMHVYSGNDTLLEDAPVQISNPTFSPSVSPGEITFSGDVTGQCDSTSTQLTLSATDTAFIYICDGWSYDEYHMALIYNDAEYTEPNAVLDNVYVYADEVELGYLSEKYGMTFTATLSNASYSDASNTVTGEITLGGTQTDTTVEIAVGNANIHDMVNPSYNYGWNYDSEDHYIFWYDEDFPDSSYEIDSAIYKIESEEMIVVAKDSEEYDAEEHNGLVDSVTYDSQENSVHGYMTIDSTRTEVQFTLGDVVPEQVEKWIYTNGTFTWVDENGNRIEQANLTITEAIFYNHELNHSDDYFSLKFSYQGVALPALSFNQAEIHEETQTTTIYYVSGFCSYISINDYVTFGVQTYQTVNAEIEDGWYLLENRFEYFYNNEAITPVLVSCDFYQFGNSDNYCDIVYNAQIPGGEIVEGTFKITDAGWRGPDELQTNYYIVTGFYEGKEASVIVGSLVPHYINHYEYDESEGGFIYVRPDEGETLGCEVTEVIFNNYGNGQYYNEAFVTFIAYTEYGTKEYLLDSAEQLFIDQAVLTTDPRYSDNQVGSLSGRWNGKEVQVSFNESGFIFNDLSSGTEGFYYLEGEYQLKYFNSTGTRFNVSVTGATYDIAKEEIEVNCFIEQIEDTLSFTLKNASYRDLEGAYSGGRYEIKGQNEDVFNGEIILYVDNLYTRDDRQEGWNYIDNMLIWYDTELGFIETEVDTVTIYRSVGSQKIEFVEVKYALYGLATDEPDQISYKTVILTEVEITSFPQQEEEVPGVLSGYFSSLAMRIDVESFVFIEKELNEEATTITPEQEAEINEYMPEIVPTTPEEEERQQRNEESLTQLSEKTAAEILSAVSSSQSEITQELEQKMAEATSDAEREQAQAEYQEKREIIETVTEASVVVGAGHQTAHEEGTAITNALPEDSGLDHMGETFNEFYQTQMDYLLGRKKAPEKRSILREPNAVTSGIDLTISKEEYGKMIKFVDTAVSNMKDAALQIRKCSSAKMKKVVKDYISVVKISSFRDFNETAANEEFVKAVKEAIMLNMQQQVIEALKRDHKPSTNADKEAVYKQQLAACEDFETFEQIVLEVLRQKYLSLGGNPNYGRVNGEDDDLDDIEVFEKRVFNPVFKSWALDDPSLNATGITLEQLTTATIETTKSNATKFTYRDSVSPQESTFFIIFGAALGAGLVAAIATPIIVGKARRRRAK